MQSTQLLVLPGTGSSGSSSGLFPFCPGPRRGSISPGEQRVGRNRVVVGIEVGFKFRARRPTLAVRSAWPWAPSFPTSPPGQTARPASPDAPPALAQRDLGVFGVPSTATRAGPGARADGREGEGEPELRRRGRSACQIGRSGQGSGRGSPRRLSTPHDGPRAIRPPFSENSWPGWKVDRSRRWDNK